MKRIEAGAFEIVHGFSGERDGLFFMSLKRT